MMITGSTPKADGFYMPAEFAPHAGTVANGHGDGIGKKAAVELADGRLQLVRHDAQAVTAAMQFGQRTDNAGIGRRGVETMGHVVGAESLENRFKGFPADAPGHGTLHETAHAIAHETAHLVEAARGIAAGDKGVVHTGMEVTQRIEQGAVEVEEDGIALFCHFQIIRLVCKITEKRRRRRK